MQKQSTIKKVLIIRNDKLGDFILSLPSFSLAKNALPNTEIVALVPNYTRQLAEAFWAIDRVIIEPPVSAPLFEKYLFSRRIRHEKFDVSITLFSTFRTGLLLLLANIDKRFAPATKIAQVFYNYKLKQRRSLSQQPEFKYNIDLVQYFLGEIGQTTIKFPQAPYLSFDAATISVVKNAFYQIHHLSEKALLIFLHPNSGGSASNLSLQQYCALAKRLVNQFNAVIIITAGPGEKDYAEQLSKLLNTTPHRIYESTHGLIDFCKHLNLADLFISGSTGPLHIAGALNVPTVGFYPKHRSATPLRWQTLNSAERRLAFTPPERSNDQNMSDIDIDSVAGEIAEKFGHFLVRT